MDEDENDNLGCGGGLFDSSEDEKPNKKNKKSKPNNNANADYAEATGLYGGSASEGQDSDVDRPPLTDADKRRRANKLRSKVK